MATQLADEEIDRLAEEQEDQEDQETREAEARRREARKQLVEEKRAKQEDQEAEEAETRRKQEARAERLGDDLLNGAAEIAEFLGTNVREVYHLAKTKRLPIGRLGRKLIASRAGLRRAARALTAI